MSISILRAADRRDVPWLNGGGVTSPVAASPEGAGADAFDWRISIATVAMDGAFSHFAGVDRCLAVLDGSMRLAFEGGRTVDLTADDAPLEFPGDIGVDATVLAGPITDLNLMVRREHWVGTARRLTTPDGVDVPIQRPVTLLLATRATVVCVAAGTRFDLAPHDAILMHDEQGATVRAEASLGTLYIVETWPKEDRNVAALRGN